MVPASSVLLWLSGPWLSSPGTARKPPGGLLLVGGVAPVAAVLRLLLRPGLSQAMMNAPRVACHRPGGHVRTPSWNPEQPQRARARGKGPTGQLRDQHAQSDCCPQLALLWLHEQRVERLWPASARRPRSPRAARPTLPEARVREEAVIHTSSATNFPGSPPPRWSRAAGLQRGGVSAGSADSDPEARRGWPWPLPRPWP